MRRIWIELRLFLDGARLSYIALFRWLQPHTYLASKIVMPLAQILFFTLMGIFAGGQTQASFFAIGNAIQLASVNGIYGVTMSIGGDRWSGALPYIFGTPANRLTLFSGRAFFHVIDGMLGVIVGLGWGVLLFHLDLGHTDLLLGCVSLVSIETMFVNNTAYFLLLVFSGANIPLAQMPAWMQSIAWALPLTRGIAASRQLIDGAQLSAVLPLLAGEVALGAIYILLGFTLFRWFEFQAKRRGTLEAF